MNEQRLNKIEKLNREEVLEALLALGMQHEKSSKALPDDAQEFLSKIEQSPYENITEVEQLARLSLAAAALDPDLGSRVEQIIDSVGSKAFVFGGAEIFLAASLGVAVMHLYYTKGKTKEDEWFETGHDNNGRPYIRCGRTTEFGISGQVSAIIEAIKNAV